MGIRIHQKGNFEKLADWLDERKKISFRRILEHYGEIGVNALKSATPIDTGETANSWFYTIEDKSGRIQLVFNNSAIEDGWFSIAIGLDQGHGTRCGGYVQGRNYIGPAIDPILEELINQVAKEVSGS